MNPEAPNIVCNQYKMPYNKLKYELYPEDIKYRLYDPINFNILK